ncbi:MAG: hypothetical protein RBR71_03685 [Gudongella sp.]|nr:hypothetical protein [Gudongella sp.]
MSYANYETLVADVVKDFDFDKVSDLSKDEFTKLLSKAIGKSIESNLSKSFIEEVVTDYISRELKMR